MSANGRHTTPGVSVRMISALIPLCFGASGSVHRRQQEVCVVSARVRAFWPLTLKWSRHDCAGA